MLYLDNAATSYIKPPSVAAAIAYHTAFTSANAGRGASKASMRAVSLISDTAQLLADLFNIANPSQIAFTNNATTALNQAVRGVMSNGGHAVITSMEHNSLIRPIHSVCPYTMVNADSDGTVSVDMIKAAVRPDTKLIAVSHASNVCGSIQPINELGAFARANNILFLADAAQSAGCLNIDVEQSNIDILAFSGHKGLLGPLGTGGLYVREGVPIEPTILGGTGSMSESLAQPHVMPDMLQTGTLNTPAIAALGSAVRYIMSRGVNDIAGSERYMAAQLFSELKNMSGVSVYGLSGGARNGTVCFNINGVDPVEVSTRLDTEYGIVTRGGLHCASRAHLTIGSGKYGAVRASFGAFNHERDVKKLVNAVNRIRKL